MIHEIFPHDSMMNIFSFHLFSRNWNPEVVSFSGEIGVLMKDMKMEFSKKIIKRLCDFFLSHEKMYASEVRMIES
jgi:hypothetical protein